MASADVNKRSLSSDCSRRLRKAPAISKPDDRNPPIPSPTGRAKMGFSLSLRRLGCTFSSSSQVYDPAAAAASRSSSELQQGKMLKKKEEMNQAAAEITRRAFAYRNEREPPFMGSSPPLGTPQFDIVISGHFHLRGYHQSEVMMPNIFSGGMDVYDRFKNWRLDVDNMSYEELLELGDRIGHVSTGLGEKEILCSLRKIKYSIPNASAVNFSTEMECKCSICQEEYEVDDEMGKLQCGHNFHIYCIKKWLLQKNTCPVCKTVVGKT